MTHSQHNKCHSQMSAMKKVRNYLEAVSNEMGFSALITDEDCDDLIKSLNKIRRRIEATYRRGGTTVVSIDDRLITVYRFAHYDDRPC